MRAPFRTVVSVVETVLKGLCLAGHRPRFLTTTARTLLADVVSEL